MPLLSQERQNEIIKLLRIRGIVRVEDLSVQLEVSTETIRRDLEKLESQKLLRRVYGGAIAIGTRSIEPIYNFRATLNHEYKNAIGQYAKKLIEDGEAIIIDLGTTTLEFARALNKHRDLFIITNSIQIALCTIEYPNTKVFLLGGSLRPKELTISGTAAIRHLKQFRVNKAILGAGGIDIVSGVTDYHLEEAELRRVMAENADEVIVLADHSKFGVKSLTQIIPSESIDKLVTDWETPLEYVEEFSRIGVEMIIASPIAKST